MSAALRVPSLARLVPVFICFALCFFVPALRAQTIWTGTAGTNWSTPGNWSTAAAPLASEDVVIPNTPNKPVILAGTAAVAKSVTVQSGGMLTVNAMGSLTIEGGSSGGLLNQGTLINLAGGLIRIGATASPGQYGLVNQDAVSNAGEIEIDRTGNYGLWNMAGTFANTGKIVIGADINIGSAGLNNEANFQNTGGELEIDRSNHAGIHNVAGANITNTGKIFIGKTASVGGPGIYNFGVFNNNTGAELSIDRTYAGIDNRQHSTFVNAGKLAIGSVASLTGPGVYNAANFQNNGGQISIDYLNSYSSGITNYDSSTVANTGKITIGTKYRVGGPGIYNNCYSSPNYPTFTNGAGGEITIDSINFGAGLHHETGLFTNSGKITIGVTLSIGGVGLYNRQVFNNNAGAEIKIDGITMSYSAGLVNYYRGSFTNSGKIVIGAALNGGGLGLYNDYQCSFTNNAGAEITIDRLNSSITYSCGLHSLSPFTNSGKITIGSAVNGGSIGLYTSSGPFTNNAGAEISIDHVSGGNIYSTNGIYNNSPFLNWGKITIGSAASGGTFGVYNTSSFTNYAGAEISIDRISRLMYTDGGGLYNSSTFANSGKITIGSTASAGHNGLYNMNGNFNNYAGGEISIDHVRDTVVPLNTHGLRNDQNFTNAGKITIGGTGNAGQWGLWNARTFNNTASGEIAVDRSDTCGLRNGSGYDNPTFANAGKIVIGAAGSVGNYGLFNSGAFSNDTCSARVEVVSNNTIVNPGNFSNAGTIVENASANSSISSNTGIVQNLNGGTFSIGSGNPAITQPGNLNACGIAVSGAILWEHDGTSGVNNASVKLTGDTSATMLTPPSGAYTFVVINGSNFIVTPTKNTGKLNGLTVADVTAIQQHVANIALLPAPFKRIAADVNKSNSITALDASLINQALLGNPAAFNQFTASWRFVPSAYIFPDPYVPWGFPEKIILNGVNGNLGGQDFKGIKLGDVVSGWANPANFGAGQPLVLRVGDQLLQAGSEATAEFRADRLDDLAAFQFALHFDPEQLELLEIEPLAALPLSQDHFGTYNLSEGEIRAVWAPLKGAPLAEAAPLFRLRFNARKSGTRLSEALRLDEAPLPAYAYTSTFAQSGVELRYSASTGTWQAASPEALQARPNPFADAFTLSFTLPEETEAELRVLDAAGRVLFSEKQKYTAGKHERTLRLESAGGVLTAQLATRFGVLTQRLAAVKH